MESVQGFTANSSHHAGDEKRLAMYQRVNEFQYKVKLWAEALTKKCRRPTKANGPCWKTA